MASDAEKSQCVKWFIESKSIKETQRKYQRTYGKKCPSKNSIRRWYDNVLTSGSVTDKKRSGRPVTSNETLMLIRDTLHESPTKSIRSASRLSLIHI